MNKYCNTIGHIHTSEESSVRCASGLEPMYDLMNSCWPITGAKLHCGCGLWQLYAYKDMAHEAARQHSATTQHVTFVQPMRLELNDSDFIYPDGQLEGGDAS